MMRKYIIGVLIGFLLTLPLSTGAQTTNNVGKKIQTEYEVVVNGKKLDVKAISINGSSFSPNRAIADALGLDIKFENKTVIFEEKAGEPMPTETPSEQPKTIEGYTVETITLAITSMTGAVEGAEVNIKELESFEASPQKVEELKAGLIKMKEELVRLVAIKAQLEAQAAPSP